jgi:hypothetical protein
VTHPPRIDAAAAREANRTAARERIRRILEVGEWPTGLPVSPGERASLKRGLAELEALLPRLPLDA